LAITKPFQTDLVCVRGAGQVDWSLLTWPVPAGFKGTIRSERPRSGFPKSNAPGLIRGILPTKNLKRRALEILAP